MDNIIAAAKGINGIIELLPDRIRIRRKGFGALILHGLKGEKEILVSQISAIQLKKASMWTNGYIQFSFLGGQESKKGLFDATKDENTVMFNTKQQNGFLLLKERLDQRLVSSRTSPNAPSNLDELEKLASLRDKGIITEEEFRLKKKQLLGL
jgi:hypothetical protein